jgi:excinuclease UvrABC helicase subunit UvrB
MWDKIKIFFGFGPKFKVGDTIRCIDDRGWNSPRNSINLKHGKTYKVLQVIKSDCCKRYAVDIGCVLSDNDFTTCVACNTKMSGVGIHWACEKRFVKDDVLVKEELNEELEEAVNEENYEKAALIRDKIKLLEV